MDDQGLPPQAHGSLRALGTWTILGASGERGTQRGQETLGGRAVGLIADPSILLCVISASVKNGYI